MSKLFQGETQKVGKLVESVATQHTDALEKIKNSLETFPLDSTLGENLLDSAFWLMAVRVITPVFCVCALSVVGGTAYLAIDCLYLKTRKEQRPSVVFWYLLRQNLRIFYLAGMLLASLNLVWNLINTRPLNEKWINIHSVVLISFANIKFGKEQQDRWIAEKSTLSIDLVRLMQFIPLLIALFYAISSGKLTALLQNKLRCTLLLIGWVGMWAWCNFIRNRYYPQLTTEEEI